MKVDSELAYNETLWSVSMAKLCLQNHWKVIGDDMTYSQQMAEGDLFDQDQSPSNNWLYAPPDSVYYGLVKYVCDYVK